MRYYIELRRRFNGKNNGDLHLSLKEAVRVLHMGRHTVLRAQDELVTKGFIRLKAKGGFHQRIATAWALTDEPVGTAPATHDYRNWTAEKKNMGAEPAPSRVLSRHLKAAKHVPMGAEPAPVRGNFA